MYAILLHVPQFDFGNTKRGETTQLLLGQTWLGIRDACSRVAYHTRGQVSELQIVHNSQRTVTVLMLPQPCAFSDVGTIVA